MTANNKKRATSTLTPVPAMLQSPSSTGHITEETPSNDAQAEERAKLQSAMERLLKNDLIAIDFARKKIKTVWSDAKLEGEDLTQKQNAASLDKIQERKILGKHISCQYPVFENYIPVVVRTGSAKGNAAEERRLIQRQLNLLCGRLLPANSDDEEDDDEEPVPIKKQESEDSEAESDLSELESEDDPDGGQDDEDEEADEEDHVPMVAITRGRPLANEEPATTKSYVNLKQHFATGIKCVEQAVVRGQVPCNNDDQAKAACEENKGVVSKKRTGGEHENGGRKFKKARAEAKA